MTDPSRLILATGATGQQGGADSEERLKMRRWFNEVGYQADIPALRQAYPTLKIFEQSLRANGWESAQPEAAGAQRGG